MAIAETLNVTHKMDDKVAELVDGGRETFSSHPHVTERCLWLDVKESNAVLQRSADIADEEKRS